MAIKTIAYIWDPNKTGGAGWEDNYARTSADNVVETDNYKVLTAAERTAIATYLDTFNAANKLIKLNAAAGFSITGGITAERFNGDVYTDYISSNSDFINIGGGISEVQINADKVNVVAINGMDLNGHLDVDGYINAISIDTTDYVATNELYIGMNTPGVNSFLIQAQTNGNLKIMKDTGSLTYSGLDVNGAKVINLGTPSAATDAATKAYVDGLIGQGTHVIAAVRVATVTGGNLSLTGTAQVDGITLVTGDRVLVKNQTIATQNGVYIVNTTGGWTKIANDSDTGSLVFVLQGTTNSGIQYACFTANTWTEYFIQDNYYAATDGGLELDLTGFGFRIKAGGITNAMIASNAAIDRSKINIALGSGLEWSGANIQVKNLGITNGMLAGSITQAKLAEFGLAAQSETYEWQDLVNPTTVQSLHDGHLINIYNAIRLLRGTSKYNTGGTQTISDLYANKNKSTLLIASAALPATGQSGDLVFKKIT